MAGSAKLNRRDAETQRKPPLRLRVSAVYFFIGCRFQ